MKVWNAVFKVPPEAIQGAPEDVEWLKEMFVFSPQPFIERVVFIATPHRGAEAAGSLLGQLGSRMVELPDYYKDRVERLAALNRDVATEARQGVIDRGAPNSIRALRPSHPVMQALGELPIDPEIPFHTIMGNRSHDINDPVSDGWVDYASVHLEAAESELIVPTGHAAYSHPGSIGEIKRILRLNLRESAESTAQTAQK